MNNLLTVREYQKIFADDCPHFDDLAKFADASDFLTLGWRYVQAKNYVGVIRLSNDYQIEILPKIDGDNDELRSLVVKMLRTLKNFSGKTFRNADLQTSHLPLYEIFIRNYLDITAELVKRGLKSSYVGREENLRVFKGKLIVGRHLRTNFAHREKFFVAFDEYGLDCPEHRLIKATLGKLLHTTRDPKNFRLTTRLLANFDSVDASTNFAKDFAAVSIDRHNRDYEVVMQWTKIFLANESFTSFAGAHKVQTLLFPMEKLFEAFVTYHVRKSFADSFTVTAQAREKYLFDVSQSFTLKPDILLTGDKIVVMDAKWKRDVPEDDMYQMFAYSKRYGATKIFLLCPPTVNKTCQCATDFSVTIFPVDLLDMNAAMTNLRVAVK